MILNILFRSYISHGSLSFTGIDIDDEELARFVEHVDKDNNGIITFEEWRDFLLLYPHEATIENIYHYWERVCLVDIGEQAVIPEGIKKHVASKYLIAGGVAGASSRTATAPLDRLKVVLQVQTTRSSIMSSIKNIWREGGFLGFFRGNGLNVVKVAPESAIKFYAYEKFKSVIGDINGEDKCDIGTSGRLIAGGMAGAVAQTAIYPMDLVKTRLQTCSSEGGRVPNLGKLSRDIWVHEGPRAFYKGLVPSLLGIIPYAGIDLAAYEALKDLSKIYVIHDSGMILNILILFFLFFLFLLLFSCNIWNISFLSNFYYENQQDDNFYIFYRTWSSCAVGLWNNFWGTWCNLCLSIAGYQNKVSPSCQNKFHFSLMSWFLFRTLPFFLFQNASSAF